MIDPDSHTRITYEEQFRQSAADTDIPSGFVQSHKLNLCKYFQLTPGEFVGKSVLETGAGPGKHAAVLHLLGAHVTAVDLLETNIAAINRLKAEHKFENFVAFRSDLMQPLPENLPDFELISAHNWLQHAADPAGVLSNLIGKLEVGGRLYLSVYQTGTFRFFLDQIAWRVLRWDDRAAVLGLAPLFFPAGFLKFENPEDIHFENVLDDFFVPYMCAFRYESLVKFLNELGCEVLTPHTGHSRLYEIDNEPLKVGLVKMSSSSPGSSPLEHEVDEFDLSRVSETQHRSIMAESVKWAVRSIEFLQGTSDQDTYIRAGFCLGLYRLRGMFSRDTGVAGRHLALQAYLQRFVTGDTDSIRAWDSSKRYYGEKAT